MNIPRSKLWQAKTVISRSGVQYHPEFTYASVVGCIARNDVRGFSQRDPLARSLGIEIAAVENVIEDFTSLSEGQMKTR